MNQQPNICTVCARAGAELFVEVPHVPVICNVLWSTRESALAARRVDIRLAFCAHCGHIFNPDYDPSLMEYGEEYENSLHFSPRFQQYVTDLAVDLVERHGLRQKQLIEIGGGKGDFLKLLCELGDNRGVSIDPSYAPGPSADTVGGRITFIQDYYSEAYAHLPADFISSRHTLEHIPDPRNFITTLRRTIGDRAQSVVFCEVPNALFTLHDLAIWDIIYEHCSYFTAHSLAYLFAQGDFEVQRVQTAFAGQFLCLEAVPGATPAVQQQADEVGALAQDIARFAHNYAEKVHEERGRLAEWQRTGQKVVIWGAGSKGITFLNTLGSAGRVEYAVDINPRKEGMFITGTGQPIRSPSFLQKDVPDVVLVMNPVYLAEIEQTLGNLGVKADVVPAL
jgi:2-polyprenyl-3-methyl-5-hydroxy-6-metoxy-1,4-benzoquinol methylase